MKLVVIALALVGSAASAQYQQPDPWQQQRDRINSGQYGTTPQQQQQANQQPGGGIYNPNDPRNQVPQGGILPRKPVQQLKDPWSF